MSPESQGQPGGVSDELHPYVDSREAEEIDDLGRRLRQERAHPPAALRSKIRASLSERADPASWRPRNLRVLAGAYVASGFALLAIAAIGLSGAGPLGY